MSKAIDTDTMLAPVNEEAATPAKADDFTLPPEEKARAKAQLSRFLNRGRLKTETNASGERTTQILTDDLKRVYTCLQAFGTLDSEVITTQLNYLINVVRLNDGDDRANAIVGMMYALAPRNEMEGMLAAQIVATNHVAMRMLSQSLDNQSLEAANHYTNRAHKAQSLMLRQLELLNTMRNGGQTTQKVVVERVMVANGGQAIVGAVAGGGDPKPKTEV